MICQCRRECDTIVKIASILKFFKYKCDVSATSSASLPEPNGSLRKKVPPKAIELANAEVTKLAENRPRGRGPYLYLTGAQRYEVGKLAAQYGTTDNAILCKELSRFSKAEGNYSKETIVYSKETVVYSKETVVRRLTVRRLCV